MKRKELDARIRYLQQLNDIACPNKIVTPIMAIQEILGPEYMFDYVTEEFVPMVGEDK